MNWLELKKEITEARDYFIFDIQKWDNYPVHSIFMAQIIFYLEYLSSGQNKFKKISNIIAHSTFKPGFPGLTNIAILEDWFGSISNCKDYLTLKSLPLLKKVTPKSRHINEQWLYLPHRIVAECLTHNKSSRYPNYCNFLLIMAGYSYLGSCFNCLLEDSKLTFNDSIKTIFKNTAEADLLHSFRKKRNKVIHSKEYLNSSFDVSSVLLNAALAFTTCYENKNIQGVLNKCSPRVMAVHFGGPPDPDRHLTFLALSGSKPFLEEYTPSDAERVTYNVS